MLRRKKHIIIFIIIISILILLVTGGIVFLLTRKNPEETVNNTAVVEFNQNFLEYEGNNISLENVKNMVNDVIQNNEDNSEHQITARILSQGIDEETKDPATLITILNDLENYEYDFAISFGYNEHGYINIITINQNIPEGDSEVLEFNKQFTQYAGNNVSATVVKSLLTTVLESNNINVENQIIVEIKNTNLKTEIVETSQLAEIQNTIVEPDRYKTEFKFNDDGYISKIYINIIENEAQNNIAQYQKKVITGKELKENLIHNMIIYNSQNPEHKSNIYSAGLKSITEIEDEEFYEITISYDEEGYPTRVDAVRQ